MHIHLEKYNPAWATSFEDLAKELKQALAPLHPVVEHIGSTSIVGLTAKPIIDILVGLPDPTLLDSAIAPLTDKGYIFYQKYNSVMPYRRFFVRLTAPPSSLALPSIFYENDSVPNEINDYKLAHIHILEHLSHHWTRHIAFRDYLKKHQDIKLEYEQLKMRLSKLDWQNGNEYNAAKNDFIKTTEARALKWFEEKEGN